MMKTYFVTSNGKTTLPPVPQEALSDIPTADTNETKPNILEGPPVTQRQGLVGPTNDQGRLSFSSTVTSFSLSSASAGSKTCNVL